MSNVTSRPIVNGKKDSAIVSRARLRKQRGAVERFTAWMVLVMSFLGTVVAFHGGWVQLVTSIQERQPNLAAWLFGLVLQGVLTFLQWSYYDHRPLSWTARLIDTFLTAIGYGPLFLAPLMGFLLARGIENPLNLAWAIIGLVSLLAAWYPESRLVD